MAKQKEKRILRVQLMRRNLRTTNTNSEPQSNKLTLSVDLIRERFRHLDSERNESLSCAPQKSRFPNLTVELMRWNLCNTLVNTSSYYNHPFRSPSGEMPRTAELIAEETASVSSPLRRSSRIVAVNLPPAETTSKPVRSRRSSATQENNDDEKVEAKPARGRRAASITKEETAQKPEPAKARTRRTSVTAEPKEETKAEPAKPRSRRSSITTEPKEDEVRQGTQEKGAEEEVGKRTLRTRRSSVHEEETTVKTARSTRSASREVSIEPEEKKPVTRGRRKSVDAVEIDPVEKRPVRSRRTSTEKLEDEPEVKVAKTAPAKPKRRLSITENVVNLAPIEEQEGERKSLSPVNGKTAETIQLTPIKKKLEVTKAELDLSIINEDSFVEENVAEVKMTTPKKSLRFRQSKSPKENGIATEEVGGVEGSLTPKDHKAVEKPGEDPLTPRKSPRIQAKDHVEVETIENPVEDSSSSEKSPRIQAKERTEATTIEKPVEGPSTTKKSPRVQAEDRTEVTTIEKPLEDPPTTKKSPRIEARERTEVTTIEKPLEDPPTPKKSPRIQAKDHTEVTTIEKPLEDPPTTKRSSRIQAKDRTEVTTIEKPLEDPPTPKKSPRIEAKERTEVTTIEKPLEDPPTPEKSPRIQVKDLKEDTQFEKPKEGIPTPSNQVDGCTKLCKEGPSTPRKSPRIQAKTLETLSPENEDTLSADSMEANRSASSSQLDIGDDDSVFTGGPSAAVEVKKESTYISTGSDDSFQLHLSATRLESGSQDEDDLNSSKTSNGSDKENLSVNLDDNKVQPKIRSAMKRDFIVASLQAKETRVSNVFRPKNIDYSFVEPMEVDKTVVESVSESKLLSSASDESLNDGEDGVTAMIEKVPTDVVDCGKSDASQDYDFNIESEEEDEDSSKLAESDSIDVVCEELELVVGENTASSTNDRSVVPKEEQIEDGDVTAAEIQEDPSLTSKDCIVETDIGQTKSAVLESTQEDQNDEPIEETVSEELALQTEVILEADTTKGSVGLDTEVTIAEESVTHVVEEEKNVLVVVGSISEEGIERADTTEENVLEKSVNDHVLEETMEPANTTEKAPEQISTTDERIEDANITEYVIEQASTEGNIENVNTAEETIEDASPTEEIIEQANTTKENNENASTTEETTEHVKKTIENESSIEETIEHANTTEENIEKPSITEEIIEKTSTTEENIEKPSITEEIIEKTSTTEENIEQATPAQEIVGQTITKVDEKVDTTEENILNGSVDNDILEEKLIEGASEDNMLEESVNDHISEEKIELVIATEEESINNVISEEVIEQAGPSEEKSMVVEENMSSSSNLHIDIDADVTNDHNYSEKGTTADDFEEMEKSFQDVLNEEDPVILSDTTKQAAEGRMKETEVSNVPKKLKKKGKKRKNESVVVPEVEEPTEVQKSFDIYSYFKKDEESAPEVNKIEEEPEIRSPRKKKSKSKQPEPAKESSEPRQNLEKFTNSKLDEFIVTKLAEFEDRSDKDLGDRKSEDESSDAEANGFLDTMAEEGEEDTPSEGSNDIVDEGESIHTESEPDTDDDYDTDDSFICDDEVKELLPGDEYDLEISPKKKRESRIINVEDIDTDVIVFERKKTPVKPKTRSRIITVSSSSDEDVGVSLQGMEKSSEGTSQRRSSITIIENINVAEIRDTTLSNRIHNLVDNFCTTIPNKGDISMNLSLEYARKSTSEECLPTETSPAKKPRLSSSLTERSPFLPQKRKMSQSLEELEVKKRKKKAKKVKKEKRQSEENKRALSQEDLQTQSFSLMNQLINDVNDRPRRLMKPATSIDYVSGSWVIDSAVVKPSTSIVSRKEIETFKKSKRHPKDFRNQMLYDSSRVKRIDTKTLLKKRGA